MLIVEDEVVQQILNKPVIPKRLFAEPWWFWKQRIGFFLLDACFWMLAVMLWPLCWIVVQLMKVSREFMRLSKRLYWITAQLPEWDWLWNICDRIRWKLEKLEHWLLD